MSTVKKYFSMIETWAWCDICGHMVDIKLDKEEITGGLERGIYRKDHRHLNPYSKDFLIEEDDVSDQVHTTYIYIDENYDIKGVISGFDGEPLLVENLMLEKETRSDKIPVVEKEIRPVSELFIELTNEQFEAIIKERLKLLKICNGMNTIERIAKIAQEEYNFDNLKFEPKHHSIKIKEIYENKENDHLVKERWVIPNKICLLNVPYAFLIAIFTFLIIFLMYYLTKPPKRES